MASTRSAPYQFHQQPVPTQLADNLVYVFDSMHYAAGDSIAAQHAIQHFGALARVGRGWSGQSFALPMRNTDGQTMPLALIQHYVDDFKIYTLNHPDFVYYIAGVEPSLIEHEMYQIAQLFRGISPNVIFPLQWQEFLNR